MRAVGKKKGSEKKGAKKGKGERAAKGDESKGAAGDEKSHGRVKWGRKGEGALKQKPYQGLQGSWPQLTGLGLRIREIVPDGNCFFRAVSDQLEGHQGKHSELRQQVVDYMEAHEPDFAPFVEDDESFSNYCAVMRREGSWAGHMEVQAMSMMLRRNICIHQHMQPRWNIVNFDPKSSPCLHLSYHDGEHYNSVRRLDEETRLTNHPQEAALPLNLLPSAATSSSSSSSSAAVGGGREGEGEVGAAETKIIKASTGVEDDAIISKAFHESGGDTSATIEVLLARQAEEEARESGGADCQLNKTRHETEEEPVADGRKEGHEAQELAEGSELESDAAGAAGDDLSRSKAKEASPSPSPATATGAASAEECGSKDKAPPRNKPCSCGSKKKFKSCCGAPVHGPSLDERTNKKKRKGAAKMQSRESPGFSATKQNAAVNGQLNVDFGALCI